jgi:phosphatidate cytidylyltransferase
MLRTRILTALVLLGVLLPTLFLGTPLAFAALLALLAAAGMWEWARLAGYRGSAALLWAGVWAGGALALLARPDLLLLRPVFALAALAWAMLLAACLPRAGLPRWLARPPLLATLGLLVMYAAWLALWRARLGGAAYLLSVLLVAWIADIAAYFGGRALGGTKLAPRISPGKTRAGVYCAALAVLAYAIGCLHFGGATLLGDVAARWGLAASLGCALLLLALSVMGDLFESLLKRHAGVKDSSALLPGHGGVLDRIDALLPLLPFALLFMR